MCGIVGWIDWERDLTAEGPALERMADTLGHRGPDAKGSWISPRAALAHRRLAVIDPEGGAQPMVREAGGALVLAFNGVIYNFRELRRELEASGHRFRTQSDTEALLLSYASWGEGCTQRLNGIFAFAIWDEAKRQLLLARDHLGVKPLYYASRGSAVLFASELKALLAHPLVAPEVGAEGLAEVLSAGPVRAPGVTVYRDVHEVRPAHMLTFEREHTRVRRYWSLESAPHRDSLQTTAERVRSLLEDAVRGQVFADVPVASLLSGGLDSSALTALAAGELARDARGLDTYSVDYAGSARDFVGDALQSSRDEPWAVRVSAQLGTRHRTVTLDAAQLLENLLVPTLSHDAPGFGQLETSLYLLCKGVKQHATVALSGESADEVFGGYPWFHAEEALAASTFPWMVTIGRPGGARDPYAWLSAELRHAVRPEAYMEQRYREALAEVPRLPGEESRAARRREISYLNLTRWLSMLLERKDRMSMAAGVEVRVPFCDPRLVQYVWNVPWAMMTAGDDIEKGLLRRAVADLLPADVTQRRKSAFPVCHDPAYLAGLRQRALDVLHDPSAPVRSFLERRVVGAVAAGDAPGVPAAVVAALLERVLQLDAWLRYYHVVVG